MSMWYISENIFALTVIQMALIMMYITPFIVYIYEAQNCTMTKSSLLRCLQLQAMKGLGTALHSKRWGIGKWEKPHVFIHAYSYTSITTWSLPSPIILARALDSHRSAKPTVNCIWEPFRMCAPLKHPENISLPTWSVEIFSYMKQVSGTKKSEDWSSVSFTDASPNGICFVW